MIEDKLDETKRHLSKLDQKEAEWAIEAIDRINLNLRPSEIDRQENEVWNTLADLEAIYDSTPEAFESADEAFQDFSYDKWDELVDAYGCRRDHFPDVFCPECEEASLEHNGRRVLWADFDADNPIVLEDGEHLEWSVHPPTIECSNCGSRCESTQALPGADFWVVGLDYTEHWHAPWVEDVEAIYDVCIFNRAETHHACSPVKMYWLVQIGHSVVFVDGLSEKRRDEINRKVLDTRLDEGRYIKQHEVDELIDPSSKWCTHIGHMGFNQPDVPDTSIDDVARKLNKPILPCVS